MGEAMDGRAVSFTPAKFLVERGKIREFVLAIGDPNPVYVDPVSARAEGHRDVIAPPTFAAVIDLWSGDYAGDCRLMGLDPAKLLHGEQEYEYFGEINPGDEITVYRDVTAAEEKKGKSGVLKVVRLETRYINQRQELVLVARSTILERR